MKLNELIKEVHANAVNKGFWEDCDIEIGTGKHTKTIVNNAIATRLALIHSETSEALEALRENDMDNFKEELADIVIRVCDLAGGLEIDLEQEIEDKVAKNRSRPYKHGKEF